MVTVYELTQEDVKEILNDYINRATGTAGCDQKISFMVSESSACFTGATVQVDTPIALLP